MCALAVPKIKSEIVDTPCIYKKDLNSIILGNASNTRFTQAQLERCANIDWITIYQDHRDKKGKLRKIDGGLILNLEDLSNLSEETFDSYLKHSNPIKIVPFKKDEEENKELTEEEIAYKELWCTHKKFLAEGSHDTRLMIFCDGTRVFLSGNVGRWGRKDNLFNLDFNQTISKCNSILKKYGLPPFTVGKSERYFSQFDGKSHLKRLYGAVVTRLDINVNFATGSPENAQYLIDYLQARSMSYVSKSVSGRSSVQWGKKGGRLYTKAYVKFEEMLRHCNKKQLSVLAESFAYQFAKNNGIVRIETEIDRKTLSETGLRDLENITMSRLVSIAKGKVDELMNDIPIGLQHFEPEKIFHKKEHKKYAKTLSIWKSGVDLMAFSIIGKSTVYAHAEAILELSGIDIKQRYIEGVTDINLSVISQISLEPVERPENYSLAIDWDAPELNIIDLTKHLPTRKQINEAIFGVSGTVPTQEFLDTDLSEPNHALITKRNAEAKERYQMRKLYEIKNQDKRAH